MLINTKWILAGLITLTAVSLTSCSKELGNQPNYEIFSDKTLKNSEKMPFKPIKGHFLENQPNNLRSAATVDDNLGMGFKAFGYPLNTASNTTFRVIDAEAILADPRLKDLISIKRMYESWSSISQYSSFEEYVEKLSSKTNMDTNFSLEFLKLGKTEFKVGFSILENDIDSVSINTTFGEVNAGIKTKSYTMNLLFPRQVDYFLSYKFIYDYYHNEPEPFYQTYGGYVLTGYDAGGIAQGLYRGVSKNVISIAQRDEQFLFMMKYSTGKLLDVISSIDFDVSADGDYDVYDGYRSNFNEFEIAFRTVGGNPGYGMPMFYGPTDPSNIQVDLQDWGVSVSDPEFYQIMNIHYNGLTPIETFIKEDNLKQHYAGFRNEGTEVRLREPAFLLDHNGYGSDVYIVTRFGDLLRISDGKLSRLKDPNAPVQPYVKPASVEGFPILFTPLQNGSSLEMEKYHYFSQEGFSLLEFGDYLYPVIQYPSQLKYDLANFEKDSLVIYTLEGDITDTKYLYLQTPQGDYAISIFDDLIKRMYGLAIEDLPQQEVSRDFFDDTTIIAL